MGENVDDDVFGELSDCEGDLADGEIRVLGTEVPAEDISDSDQEEPAQRRRPSSAEKWYEEFKAPLLAGAILGTQGPLNNPSLREPIVMNIFVNADVAGLVARIANARTQARCEIDACTNAIAMITAQGPSEDVKIATQLMYEEEARLLEAMSSKPVKVRRFTAGQVLGWIKREKIATMLRSKVEVPKICKELECCDKTVYTVRNLLKNNQSLAPKPISGRPPKRDKEFLGLLCNLYGADPFISYRTAAENLGVSRTTVGDAIHQLGMRSYVKRIRCMVSANGKQKRLERCEDLIEWLKEHPSTIIIFSDKVDLL